MKRNTYKSQFSYVSGMKHRPEFQRPNSQVVRKAAEIGITRFFQTCAGGLGLIILFFLPNNHKCKRFIADIDEDKVNLYTCIRDEYYTLINAIKDFIKYVRDIYAESLSSCYESFKSSITEDLTGHLTSKGYDESIIKAALTFLTLIHSQRDTKATIQERIDELEKKMPFIWELNGILQGVEIWQADMMDIIKQYSRKGKFILFVDPPYLLTNGKYAVNEPEIKFHQRLAALLCSCKCKFVLYCRVTASKFSGKNKYKRLIDDVLLTFYNSYYSGKGFYYYDVELKHGNDVTIERMITNLDMSGEEGWKKY